MAAMKLWTVFSPDCAAVRRLGVTTSVHIIFLMPTGQAAAQVKNLEFVCRPTAFGIVEEGIYRSNAFQAEHYAFIQRLALKTIIYLSPELTRLHDFFEECSIRFHHQGLKVWRPDVTWKPVCEELIKEALEFVLDERNHPVMIMCSSGIHETGALVGCLRRLQCRNMSSIIEEYRRFAGSKARYAIEQFIELFDIDLVCAPPFLPLWLQNDLLFLDAEQEERQKLRASAKRRVERRQSLSLELMSTPSLERCSTPRGVGTLKRVLTPDSLTSLRSEFCHQKMRDDLPAFKRHLYDMKPGPLVSKNVTYDKEASIVVDED